MERLKKELINILTLINIVLVIAVILCIKGIRKHHSDGVNLILSIISVLIVFILIISMGTEISKMYSLRSMGYMDERIKMYETENKQIETNINETVKSYLKHEKQVFENVVPKSGIQLITLYPNLKSDILVKNQMDIYVKNNNKIKGLKEEKIDVNMSRWWLYFG